MDRVIPIPFLFNTWKHHTGFLKEFIHDNRSQNHFEIKVPLLKMGKSVIDLYFGDLSIDEIIIDVKRHLQGIDCFSKARYQSFIKLSKGEFLNIIIRDGSTWTLLIGNDPDRFIHLHPARGSDFTVRVRATALKTAVVLSLFYSDKIEQTDIVELINKVRLEFLGESPVKNQKNIQGVKKVLEVL